MCALLPPFSATLSVIAIFQESLNGVRINGVNIELPVFVVDVDYAALVDSKRTREPIWDDDL